MTSVDQAFPRLEHPTSEREQGRIPVRDIPLQDVVSERTRELVERRRVGHVRRRGWLVRRALLAADVVGLVTAFLVALSMAGPDPAAPVDRLGAYAELLAFLATLPLWILATRLYGLYDRDEERTDHSTVDDVIGVFNVVTIAAWLFFAGTWLTGLARPTVGKIVVFWIAAIVLVSLCRALARSVCRRRLDYVQNTVIVGAGRVGQLAAKKLIQHPEYGVNLVGFIDEHPMPRRGDIGDLTVLGTTAQLPRVVDELDVERVILAFSQAPHDQTLETIRELTDLDVQVDIVPRYYEALGGQFFVHSAEGLPLLGLPRARLPRSSLFLKRALDLLCSAAGLVTLAPLFAVVAIAIKLDSPGPVLFRQVRRGRGDSTFRIVKFRTMGDDAEKRKADVAHLNKHDRPGGDPRMFKVPDDPRMTRVGRLLRRTSLDELPQLWNVLVGQMSLVGPRPLILEEDRHVDGRDRRRLDLKPGITGLWQVLGRDDIPFAEMLMLDYRYVTTWSLANDLKLLFRTLPVVLRGRAS